MRSEPACGAVEQPALLARPGPLRIPHDVAGRQQWHVADVERAANVAVFWGLANAGQTCMSVERVYVEEPVYDQFVQKVVDKVGALRVGAPAGRGSTDIGAITAPRQVEIIERHIADAVGQGARVVTGGRRHPLGRTFSEPTVLANVTTRMLITREEVFGPVAPVYRFADEADVIARANATEYLDGGRRPHKALNRGVQGRSKVLTKPATAAPRPRPIAPKPAATAAAVPPLDPAVTRSSA